MYSRVIDGQMLTFAASGWTWRSTFVLYDQETESLWFGAPGEVGSDALTCIAGYWQDRTVPRVDHFRMMWRSWYYMFPETKIMHDRAKVGAIRH